jgi:hypothetical protein
MVRRLAIRQTQRQQQAQTYSLPAPVLGLNGRDGLAGMDPRYAPVLDNFFPSTNQLIGRSGSASWATGMTGPVETLIPYANGTTKNLLAANNKKIYDVSPTGAVGAALASSLTNNRWQYVNYKGLAIFVNGTSDGCLKYDGSTVATNSVTGAAGNLANVAVFSNRLFFLDDTLSFYYLATQAVSGALAAFDLSTYVKLGGFLMAQGDWSYLGTNSINDYAVFLTSEGEVIVFQGSDPTSSTTWSMAATFKIGKPIGRRCMVKYGAELILITEDGFVPMSGLMQDNREEPGRNISDVLGTLVAQDINLYGGNFGWEGTVCPKSTLGPMALFNVPTTENSTAYQYVINLRTQAWCRFVGWKANTFAVFNSKIFFGGNDGVVYQADVGANDSGSDVVFDGKTAFSYMDAPDVLKKFLMARPILSSQGIITPAIICNHDFEDILPTDQPTFIGDGGSPWDTSPWDTSPWGGGDTLNRNWIGIEGFGYCAALRVKVALNGIGVKWASTDFMFEAGGIL